MLDAHSHLSFLPSSVAEEVLKTTALRWILGGYDPRDWARQEEIQVQWPDRVQTCFGIHPWVFGESPTLKFEDMFEKWCEVLPRAHFVGEIGLDWSIEIDASRRVLQKEFFLRQLRKASDQDKPVVFHIVQAYQDAFEIIDSVEPRNTKFRGFVHGFSGAIEVAREFFKRNIWISIGPQILNPQFKKLRNTVVEMDLDKFLIESDSPSKPNDQVYGGPSLLIQIVDEIARLRKMPSDELIAKLNENQSVIWAMGAS